MFLRGWCFIGSFSIGITFMRYAIVPVFCWMSAMKFIQRNRTTALCFPLVLTYIGEALFYLLLQGKKMKPIKVKLVKHLSEYRRKYRSFKYYYSETVDHLWFSFVQKFVCNYLSTFICRKIHNSYYNLFLEITCKL